MERSCESFLTATLAAVAGANVAGAAVACDGFAAGDVVGPGVAGAVCAGRLACVGWTGGFGPKNFAQRMITPKESSEATRIRNSGVNLSFCRGALTSAPQGARLLVQLNSMASLPISPEPGRNQSCAREVGSAAAASVPAKLHTKRRIVQSLHRHSENTLAQSGNFPRTRSTNTLCRNAARPRPHAQEWIAFRFVSGRFVLRQSVQGRNSVRLSYLQRPLPQPRAH